MSVSFLWSVNLLLWDVRVLWHVRFSVMGDSCLCCCCVLVVFVVGCSLLWCVAVCWLQGVVFRLWYGSCLVWGVRFVCGVFVFCCGMFVCFVVCLLVCCGMLFVVVVCSFVLLWGPCCL